MKKKFDGRVWINDSWGGHQRVVKSNEKTKLYPKWIRVIITVLTIILVVGFIGLIIYLSNSV
tara:strand:+ start:7682 stop:7867 length:186 start_codon:yes stop_codon:yes gene_type:complete